MSSYLLIGLGGALGSMSRAWTAIAMARITGPQFPWGTILVNILGSFIIGFFGTLTATDGRFGLSADARAFVMIGFCGGFTTFSSFSLQTFDLARDGRAGQAFANAALSLALCLASVAVGHYGAAALKPGRLVEGEAVGRAARPSVLAVLSRPEMAEPVLSAAARMLAIGGGRLHALALLPPPAASFLPSEEVLTEERAAELAAFAHTQALALRAAFAQWQRAQGAAPAMTWAEIEGPPGARLADEIKTANARAIVIAQPSAHHDPLGHEALHAALFDCGRPVLLVPPGANPEFGRVVAIAWRDDDARAAAAVTESLACLRQAERVMVLRARRPGGLPAMLTASGLAPELVPVAATDGPVGAALLEAARRRGADLLVMGAYTHGAWREAVLGGVTRHVLAHATLPVLLRH